MQINMKFMSDINFLNMRWPFFTSWSAIKKALGEIETFAMRLTYVDFQVAFCSALVLQHFKYLAFRTLTFYRF